MKQNPEVDLYITQFPAEAQKALQLVRETIQKTAPQSEEVISYKMPAYKINSVIVYFAGYKSHVGFYPFPSGIGEFQKKFEGYKWAKGSVQFPLDKPMPVDLIADIVKFRMKEDAEDHKAKKLKKTK